MDLRIPQRGEKKDLLATVTENAQEALRLHRLKRTGDLTARTKALEDLGEALELAEQFADFMAGNTSKYVRRIEKRMKAAAAAMDYETAASLRDDLKALEKVMEKNSVVLSDATDADLIGFAQDELEASVQVFHVRGGRIRGQRGWTAEILDDSAAPDLIERALTTLYSEGTAPREVLVPVLPRNRAQIHRPADQLQDLLTGAGLDRDQDLLGGRTLGVQGGQRALD